MSMHRTLKYAVERFPIAGEFRIARGRKTEAVVIVASIANFTGACGRGECVPYRHYGETIESVSENLEQARTAVEEGASREELLYLMKPSAARNAIDCALWDLEAKADGTSVVAKLGLSKHSEFITAFTISLADPQAMGQAALVVADRALLKIKLGGADGLDPARLKAIRTAAPRARLIIDANEGWHRENLPSLFQACVDANVSLIEQPLPRDQDEILRTIPHPVALCADESVHDSASLPRLKGLYEFINIKLDKAGGLTEALRMAQVAQSEGLNLMVGCMVGSSLAMAPALMLASRCQFIDLDGPLLLAVDRTPSLGYHGSAVQMPEPELWG